ncbi:putative ABC transporter ATP-binding protein [Gordonia effusa NBRC 100432]|uniref:Putative ABC transporter ATP-binding protein n=1 Tax=Gordonia effusa NBRC 100432 TaxID=1077974 RepID=H0R5R7_9ACTN|nr:ATP-binding cassette domain-containing protein [Gordonia effusa]GAB20418.1 putative ABC transporter ATP-binding protein [Gordonia effusa NBRC 100432]
MTITVRNLTKIFGTKDTSSTVLDDVSFSVESGEIFAVVGPSGAGKSTLARCINLLERPTFGEVIVNGDSLTQLTSDGLRQARRRIGTVFQSSSLLSRRTAAANVALPLEYLGATAAATKSRVAELLERVGLADKANLYPHQLSGGQRQRVGIARALALKPSVLLSDEATSGLDQLATDSYLSLLAELRTELDLAVVLITHEMETVVTVADRVGRLEHGTLVEQGDVVDIALDARSTLGAQLRSPGRATAAAHNTVPITVTYASPAVPADWINRLSVELSTPISILGANVQSVNGIAVGEVTIGIAAINETDFLRSAKSLGLEAQSLSARTDLPHDTLARVSA